MSKPIDGVKKGTKSGLCDYCVDSGGGVWCAHQGNVDYTEHDTACTQEDWEHCELKHD